MLPATASASPCQIGLIDFGDDFVVVSGVGAHRRAGGSLLKRSALSNLTISSCQMYESRNNPRHTTPIGKATVQTGETSTCLRVTNIPITKFATASTRRNRWEVLSLFTVVPHILESYPCRRFKYAHPHGLTWSSMLQWMGSTPHLPPAWRRGGGRLAVDMECRSPHGKGFRLEVDLTARVVKRDGREVKLTSTHRIFAAQARGGQDDGA